MILIQAAGVIYIHNLQLCHILGHTLWEQKGSTTFIRHASFLIPHPEPRQEEAET